MGDEIDITGDAESKNTTKRGMSGLAKLVILVGIGVIIALIVVLIMSSVSSNTTTESDNIRPICLSSEKLNEDETACIPLNCLDNKRENDGSCSKTECGEDEEKDGWNCIKIPEKVLEKEQKANNKGGGTSIDENGETDDTNDTDETDETDDTGLELDLGPTYDDDEVDEEDDEENEKKCGEGELKFIVDGSCIPCDKKTSKLNIKGECVPKVCGENEIKYSVNGKCIPCNPKTNVLNIAGKCVPKVCGSNELKYIPTGKCITCNPKTHELTISGKCVPKICPANSYKYALTRECIKCGGSYNGLTAGGKCTIKNCANGLLNYYWDKTQQKCVKCPPKTRFNNETQKCEPCPNGKIWWNKENKCVDACPDWLVLNEKTGKCYNKCLMDRAKYNKNSGSCETLYCPINHKLNVKTGLCEVHKCLPGMYLGIEKDKKKCLPKKDANGKSYEYVGPHLGYRPLCKPWEKRNMVKNCISKCSNKDYWNGVACIKMPFGYKFNDEKGKLEAIKELNGMIIVKEDKVTNPDKYYTQLQCHPDTPILIRKDEYDKNQYCRKKCNEWEKADGTKGCKKICTLPNQYWDIYSKKRLNKCEMLPFGYKWNNEKGKLEVEIVPSSTSGMVVVPEKGKTIDDKNLSITDPDKYYTQLQCHPDTPIREMRNIYDKNQYCRKNCPPNWKYNYFSKHCKPNKTPPGYKYNSSTGKLEVNMSDSARNAKNMFIKTVTDDPEYKNKLTCKDGYEMSGNNCIIKCNEREKRTVGNKCVNRCGIKTQRYNTTTKKCEKWCPIGKIYDTRIGGCK